MISPLNPIRGLVVLGDNCVRDAFKGLRDHMREDALIIVTLCSRGCSIGQPVALIWSNF
jgi:hypothetical protein